MTSKTKTFRAIVIDDELDAIEVLCDMINEHCPDIEIIGTASSGKAGLQLLEKELPDILFLDIQMPGISGFDLLRNIQFADFHTIFVSAHSEYAVEAFKFHATAYLLKPVGVEELQEALDTVKQLIATKQIPDYEAIWQSFKYGNQRRIAIPTGAGYRYLSVEEIIRIEAAKNYSNVFHTGANKPILVSKNLKQFEILLSKHQFLRIHNAHLVNLIHIQEYIRKEGGAVILSDSMKIFLGPNYRQLVVDTLNRFTENL